MWTLLSVFLCATVTAEEACATCESPPAQSSALLQSSVQRHAKHAGAPHVFSPAQLFGPGAKGRQMQSVARRGPHMGPHMGPNMGPHPNMPPYNFEQRLAIARQSREESLYGSLYGGSQVTPCESPRSFLPDKEMYGWCDLWNILHHPDEATCNSGEGCRFSWGSCHCDTAVGCTAVGGTWNGWTCMEEFDGMMPEYMDKIREAAESGTCEGKDVHGWQVKDMVAWPASQCCTDYPNTMCEKNVQPMTPCKSEAEYLPDAYSYAWCDLSSANPPKETCDATPECKEEWGWCNCKTQASCEALGGYFMGTTCSEEVKYWYPSAHKGVREALEKGTCQGVQGSWGDIKYQVDYIGHSCCASGKSVCEELDHYDSGYSQFY